MERVVYGYDAWNFVYYVDLLRDGARVPIQSGWRDKKPAMDYALEYSAHRGLECLSEDF